MTRIYWHLHSIMPGQAVRVRVEDGEEEEEEGEEEEEEGEGGGRAESLNSVFESDVGDGGKWRGR